MPQEDVLIDFKVDYTELTNAQEQLAKTGKIDPAGFKAVQAAISTTAKEATGLAKTFNDVKTTATQMTNSVVKAVNSGVQDGLKKTTMTAKEFQEQLKKSGKSAADLFNEIEKGGKKAVGSTTSLRQELRNLTQALAQAKVNGTDVGAEFDAMRLRAGKLKDAISDASKEIRNAGSDTRQIDNVVGSINALAGGFAVAQGAAALFGDENKDIQKTLVKVNAALAISMGVQQIANALTKEGSLVKLADTIATGGQTAALKLYTFVAGGATVATKVLRAALIATGIGAIVFLLIEAASAMGLFGGATKKTKSESDKLTESLEKQKTALDNLNESIDRDNKLQLEKLKQQGATKQQLFDKELQGKKKQLEEIETDQNKFYQDQAAIRDKQAKNAEQLEKFSRGSIRHSRLIDEKAALDEQLVILNTSLKASQKARKDAASDIKQFEAEFRTEQLKDQAEADKKAREEREKAAKDARLAELDFVKRSLELQLSLAEKGSQKETDIKKAQIKNDSLIELENEKLTAKQRTVIIAKSLSDQPQLQKEFNKKATELQLQAQVDTNNALLAGLNVSNAERLQLQIENINLIAQKEINAAAGNSAAILAIKAKELADIRALKLAAIDRDLADDLASSKRTSDIVKSALSRLSGDTKKSMDVRIAAIKGVEGQELVSIDKQIAANQEKYDKGLISAKDYNDKYEELVIARGQIESEAEEKTKELRIANLKEIAQTTLEVALQVADFFAQLGALASEQDRQRIDLQKQQLQALVDAGAITEKQARIRSQQLEILERQAKQRQAQREKSIAVFNALIGIPQAVLKGLQQGGPILAAIYGAIAVAQAALIIARPVPKFFRGKRDRYQGPGIVADQGSEIVERGGRMFLYTKPTHTYLGAMDKVRTASETRAIMHNTSLNTTLQQVRQPGLDYAKLAKAIPKHSVNINIATDFVEESVGRAITKYYNNRYKF